MASPLTVSEAIDRAEQHGHRIQVKAVVRVGEGSCLTYFDVTPERARSIVATCRAENAPGTVCYGTHGQGWSYGRPAVHTSEPVSLILG